MFKSCGSIAVSRNMYKGLDKTIVHQVRIHAKKLKVKLWFFNVDLEDLEQELMMEVFAALDVFNPAIGKLSTFVQCILEKRSNNIIKKLTNKKKSKNVVFIPISNEANYENNQTENIEALERKSYTDISISKLPPKYGEVYETLKNNNVVDTAKILGISINTVYVRLRFLKKHIKDLMDKSTI